MAFVDDDERELVPREAVQPPLRLHRLYGSDDDGVRNLVPRHDGRLLCLFKPGLDTRRGAELVDGLLQKLASMGEDENATAANHLPRGKVREDNGLSATRREDDERGTDAARELGLDGGDRLFLVGA